MTNDFERIKNALPLLTAISRTTGLTMKGKHLSECPFCSGHECFSIFNKGNGDQYKCHQCGESGDVITFIEKKERLSGQEILKRGAELAGIKLALKKDSGAAGMTSEMSLTIKESIYLAAAIHYHGHMLENGGKDYFLKQRGHKEEVLKDLQVGWTDGGLVEHLKAEGFSAEEIKQSWLGKIIKRDDVEHLVDRYEKGFAIFPHFLKKKVVHFTHKDPLKRKEKEFQLPNAFRDADWRFYNQDALNKFGEVIVVEGENDLASVKDAEVNNVIGLIGSPSEAQMKALQDYCRMKHLYLWTDNDEDPAKPYAKGKGYIRSICQKLGRSQNIRIIVHPSGPEGSDTYVKDPDEYLQAFKGDKRKEIKRLQDEALDYLSWEIMEIGKLPTLDDRLKALKDKDRRVLATVAEMVEAEKLVFIEKLMKLGFTESSIEEELETNLELKVTIQNYLYDKKKEADPNHVAGLIFKNLSEAGRFYRDRMGDVYLLYHHAIYNIGNNRPFNALIKKLTGLLPTKEPGRSVWESLASEAYNSGMQIDLASWFFTDRATDSVFVNFNSPNSGILKISPTGIEELQNGMNKEGVLLKSSMNILPMNFLPDASIQEGMTALKKLVFDNLTCEREQRYLILCWFFSAFMIDFSPYAGLMKFSGTTAAGKTTGAKILSLVMYGKDDYGDPSAAAAYAEAAQNPLLIIDNLENEDMTKTLSKFLLNAATKGGKKKRTQGTDSGTVQEKPQALTLITAIEPFVKAELINRTFDIDFSFKFKNESFVEDEVIRSVIKKRDLILSAILKFISRDILPNLDVRKDYITVLKKEHKNHAKDRTDEYLALLMLMLEKLLKYVPYYEDGDFLAGVPNELLNPSDAPDKVIRNAWIDYQNAKAKDTETSSNSIIKLLDGLASEYLSKMKGMNETTTHDDCRICVDCGAYGTHKKHNKNVCEKCSSENILNEEVFIFTHSDYHIEVVKTKPKSFCLTCHKIRDSFAEGQKCECTAAQAGDIYSRAIFEFTATSSEMVDALDLLCRSRGIKNPYGTASVFTKRLSNDEKTLKSAGWELVKKDEEEGPYFKKIHGTRFLKFRKVIVR